MSNRYLRLERKSLIQSSLEKYKDLHIGKSAVILTCGPSLLEYDKEKMQSFCQDKIVFTIKQAIKKYPEISDYHFFNDNNFCKYDTPAVKIASSANPLEMKRMVWKDQEIDIMLKVSSVTWDIRDSVSYKKNFDRMLIKEGETSRPWGPGIMDETVLPLVLYTGIKEIYVNGWDYTTVDGKLKHYYDEKKAEKHLINTGKEIGTMSYGEKEVFLSSTEYLYDFLKEINVDLHLLSSCSQISDKFNRIKY